MTREDFGITDEVMRLLRMKDHVVSLAIRVGVSSEGIASILSVDCLVKLSVLAEQLCQEIRRGKGSF